jgi:hypothetical protein
VKVHAASVYGRDGIKPLMELVRSRFPRLIAPVAGRRLLNAARGRSVYYLRSWIKQRYEQVKHSLG